MTSRMNVQANVVIVFQHKALDTTNSYTTGDGIFVVPEDGIYVLSWTITTGDNTLAPTVLMVNGDIRGKTIADDDHDDDYVMSTGILVTQLTRDDHVYVKFAHTYTRGYILHYEGQSSFSGWKLN